MPPFLAELLGTILLVILGDGVVANVVLNKTGATLSALARLGLLAGSLNSQGRSYFVDISDLVGC